MSKELRLTGKLRKILERDEINRACKSKLEKAMEDNLKESSKLCSMIIDAGFGSMRFNETAERRNESPVFARYVDLGNECSIIREELNSRMGYCNANRY